MAAALAEKFSAKIARVAHLPLALNQCCSETPHKILFRQHRPIAAHEEAFAERELWNVRRVTNGVSRA
jgi:hypothetical protein